MTITALRGRARGAGSEFALATDIRFTSKAKDEGAIQLSEAPGENVSFGQGLAPRAFIS